LTSLSRNFLLGLGIMGVATLFGLAQNSLRNRPMALIPRVQAGPAGALDSSTGGQTPTPASLSSASPEEGIASIEEVKESLGETGVHILDARSQEVFADGHIAGALNIPYDRFTEYYDFLLATIPMTDKIICYCWSKTCDFSDQLAQELRIMGYTNVLIFREGWEAWQTAGYPSEPQ
jgi:rhodanese-related sulfurtransferase